MKRLASSQAIGQLSLLAITPLLTRMYSPSEIGVFQIAFVLGVAFAPLLTLKLDAFIPGVAPEIRASTSRLATIVTGAAGLLSIVALAICLVFQIPATQPFVMPICALLVASIIGATAVDSAVLISAGARSRLATRNLLAGTVAAALQVLLGLIWPTVYALTLAMVAGRFLALVLTMKRNHSSHDSPVSMGASLKAIGPRDLLFAIASAVSAALSPQVGLVAIGAGAGASAAGQFALAQRSSTAPAMLVGVGLSQHYAMEIGALVRAGQQGAWRATISQIKSTWHWSVLVSASIAMVGLFGFEFLFGTEWKTAGIVTAMLAPALSMQIALAPLGVGFALLGKQSWHFYLEAGKLAVNLVVLGVLIWVGVTALIPLTVTISCLMFAGHCAFFVVIRGATTRWDREHTAPTAH